LKTHFFKLLAANGVSLEDSEKLLNLLIMHYSEEGRYYHNLRHVHEMLTGLENYRDDVDNYLSIYFAIWFHDSIFDPMSQNNEEESADLAASELQKLKFSDSIIRRCCQMVLSTKHHVPNPFTNDCQLLLDLDLLILGQPKERYQEYSLTIRKEYSWVPENTYIDGRSKVLERFLNRERIYFTDKIFQEYEPTARENLIRELETLAKAKAL
jgi:predicted metal-dependent HD superfamily phosphohydrolase